MNAHDEAVKLAEKYGFMVRTHNSIDGPEASCYNCGHILTDELAAMIAAVEHRARRDEREKCAPPDISGLITEARGKPRTCNECSGEGYFIGMKNRRVDCGRCNGHGTLYARAKLEEGK